MDSLEVIVKFNLDSTLSIMRIKWQDMVYDTSYRIFYQWPENNLTHCYSIDEKQNKIFELTYDNYYTWNMIKEETL